MTTITLTTKQISYLSNNLYVKICITKLRKHNIENENIGCEMTDKNKHRILNLNEHINFLKQIESVLDNAIKS